jgi:hypothetical protein
VQSYQEAPSPFECFVWQTVPFAQHEVPSQQRLPQATGVAPGQAHAPAVQTFVPGHGVSQAPQFAVLVCVFTHAPEQLVSPAAQHRRFWQLGVEPLHEFPQAPQLEGSNWGSTQPAPQSSGKAVPVQAQAPEAQVEWSFCAAQDAPQVPQFAGSRKVFTQRGFPPQSEDSGVPAQTQAPPVQEGLAGTTPVPAQASPQAPQSSGSFWTSTHAPGLVPHALGSARGHEHAGGEPAQTPFWGQRTQHAPQFCALVERSTHDPQQVSPAPQVTPQPPQFEGSRLASTHEPPHSICGSMQLGWALQPPTPASARARARIEGRWDMPHDPLGRTPRPTGSERCVAPQRGR